MSNKSKHNAILSELYLKYKPLEAKGVEFTWDGPSDWNQWDSSSLKILFLVKEARNGFHPCIPHQGTRSKFSKNVARWTLAIKGAIIENSVCEFPLNSTLSTSIDDVAIIEVKKLNEEKRFSSDKEILSYAKNDSRLIGQQIDAIEPEIVVCCSTFSSYKVIYNDGFKTKQCLNKIGKNACWLIDNRLVIDFYHPSTWQAWVEPNPNDLRLFALLSSLLDHPDIRSAIRKNVLL
jgi:hypothetical protein